jgi:hypothetical protein
MTFFRASLFAALATGAVLAANAAGCGGGDDSPPEQPAEDAGPAETGRPASEAGPERPPGLPSVECQIGTAIEIEPNDTAQTATPFTELSFCGVLETAADVDYATFDTPPGMKLGLFQGVIDGKVDFELTVGGITFGPGETTKFDSGTYLVKAFTTAGKPASYRFRIQFEPK